MTNAKHTDTSRIEALEAENERLVSVSIRLPQWLVDWYDEQGTRSKHMRHALEQYTKE